MRNERLRQVTRHLFPQRRRFEHFGFGSEAQHPGFDFFGGGELELGDERAVLAGPSLVVFPVELAAGDREHAVQVFDVFAVMPSRIRLRQRSNSCKPSIMRSSIASVLNRRSARIQKPARAR